MTTTKKRAPGMTPEQRRDMIVAAALPLVAEYGTAVTTSRIARAAGIGEATIFRVFADKDEVLDACMAEAARPDHALRQLASIELDQPLTARLTEAVDALRGYLDRLGAVAGALVGSGHRRERPAPAPERKPGVDPRKESMAAIDSAITELIEPDEDSLRYSAARTASVFAGLVFTQGRNSDPLSTEDLIDMLLHGCVNGDAE